MRNVLIIGAGYHGKVLARTIATLGGHRVRAFIDDNPDLQGEQVQGVHVYGPLTRLPEACESLSVDHFAVGVGEAHRLGPFLRRQVPEGERTTSQVGVRRAIYSYAKGIGLTPTSLVHPRALVTETAHLGPGAYLAPSVIIHYDCVVGENVILFTGTTLDHDNVVGDHVFIGPGTHTGGQVTIGEGSYIGPGDTIGGGSSIGRNCVIGAGSTVLGDIPDGALAFGTPARVRSSVSEWLDA